MGVKLPPFAYVLAPGIVLAQAIGRWGNWFNQELYGKPTTLPWGWKIDEAHRVPGYESYETFHPTYLYEFFWTSAPPASWSGPTVGSASGTGARCSLRDGLHRRTWLGSNALRHRHRRGQ